MKGYVEKIINKYPMMVRERDQLKRQLNSQQFLSVEDLISAMSFSHPEGDRVQSSDLSDKTAKIAMVYQEKLDKINTELIEPMQKKYNLLNEEITFFESAVEQLPEELADIIKALYFDKIGWDVIEYDYYMSRKTICNYRKRAIDSLVRIYQKRASSMEAALLS